MLFLFQNIRQVILAEEWCGKNGIEVKVIPVPREYSSECGMCLELSTFNGDSLHTFLTQKDILANRIRI
jgi:hypothetical protein